MLKTAHLRLFWVLDSKSVTPIIIPDLPGRVDSPARYYHNEVSVQKPQNKGGYYL